MPYSQSARERASADTHSGIKSRLSRRRSTARATACGLRSLIRQRRTFWRFSAVKSVVQHLIHQQLPFAIRVTGVNHFIGFEQQLLIALSCLLTEGRGCKRHFSGMIGRSANDQRA